VIKRINLFFQLTFLFLTVIWNSCDSPVEISAWDIVDGNSILVYESKRVPLLPDKIFKPFLLKSNLYLSAVQNSSKDDFDLVYLYAISKVGYDSILNHPVLPAGSKIQNRQFNGIEIHEVKSLKNEIQLAFTYIHGVFVISKSSLLIENGIRVFQQTEKKNFRKNNENLFLFPSLKSDLGNLYINNNHLAQVLPAESTLIKSIPILNDLRNLSVYDVKANKGFLSLSGFSLGKNSSISLFQKQRPVPFKIAKYIPNYSTSLIHFGASDFGALKQALDSSSMKGFDIGNEIAFMASADSPKSLAALVEYKSGSLDSFDFIEAYSETYSNYQIRAVNGRLLKTRFGKIFPDVSFGFCTIKDNYVMFAQSVEEVKSFLDAIESDDTWGKTLEYQKFIEKGLQESNITLILKRPDIFSEAHGILKNYPTLIDSLGLEEINWCSVQMSALDNHFYSIINFSLGTSAVSPSFSKQSAISSLVELPSAIQFVSLVKNHNTGLQELLIQDDNLTIYLLSLKEGIIWKRQIDAQIQGPLVQVDLYKNNKLQYFFSSGNKLHLIDRLGRDVSGFPKSLSSSIKYSRVVDYDKSKNYRYLVSLSTHEVFLYDKQGKNLSDWGPKKFNTELVFAPEHIKIGGRDYFIVFLKDGTAQIFNRRGDRVNSLGLGALEKFGDDYFIEPGMSVAETNLFHISKDGELVKQNLSGEDLSTENLLRGKNSKFILRRISNREGFYVYRMDADKIAVFDKQGKILFEKQNAGSVNMDFQCIASGNNRLLFAFHDLEQKLVYVYDEKGNSIIQTPLESDNTPILFLGKSDAESGIYSFPRNSVVFTSFK